MALTIQQLLTPLTAAQFRAIGVTILQGLGLAPQNWKQGGIASSVLTVSSTIAASLSTQLSNAIAQQWNPTASGGGLQLLSNFFYGFNPPQATFATGNETLQNAGGGVYSYGAGQVAFASTVANSDGVFPVYTNTVPFTIGAGTPSVPTSSSPNPVPIQCVNVQGSAGNAPPGAVTSLVTSMLGVSATNAGPIVGSDELSDPALRSLNIASLGVQSVYGPRSAYAYAIATAVNISTGLPVNVNRQSISVSSHTGDVTIYVASPAGPVITGDLEGISNNIEKLARPDGVTVLPGLPGFPSAPGSAATVPYTAAITVYCLAPVGTTAATLVTAIDNALDTWFEGETNPIGGLTASDDANTNFNGIFASGITGIIAQAVATVPGCLLLSTLGAVDLGLAAGQVATNSVTISVVPQSVS